MALESASYPTDLVSANPIGSDSLSQADDHIRLIKGVIKSTFPNLDSAVTSSPLKLNTYLVPQGAILMWSGSSASIPSGWVLCNGQTAAKADGSGNVTVPNLTDRFIVGAGGAYSPSATGGAVSNTPTITMSNASVTLTADQIPAHTHTATVTDPGHSHTVSDPGHSHSYNQSGGNTNQAGVSGNYSGAPSSTSTGAAATGLSVVSNTTGVSVSLANTGGGAGHTHANTATSSSVPTLPPYYALCFIYKL